MSNRIEKLTEKENKFSLLRVLGLIFCLSIIRLYLESFSSPNPSGFIFPWNGIYLHVPLYYVSFYLTFSILLLFFTRTRITKIFSYLLWINIFILIPPIIDLIMTGGAGLPIHYTLIWPKEFPITLIKTMVSEVSGITPGLHVSGFVLLVSVFFYIYDSTKKIVKSITGVFIGYLIFVFYSITPSFFIINIPVNTEFAKLAYENQLIKSLVFTTQPVLESMKYIDQLTLTQNTLFGQVFWILILVQSFFLFRYAKNDSSKIINTTIRTERIFNYFLIAVIGMLISSRLFGPVDFNNIANIVSIVTYFLLLGLILIWETIINDAEDVEIDRITNKDRPLAKGIVSIKDWTEISNIIGLLALFGIMLMNPNVTFFLILLTASYYIYSVKPLRLKRHFLSSSLLIGLATVSTAMAGFFLVSRNQKINAFPVIFIFVIGLVQALLSNLKDIKDFEGDRRDGIRTIPVVFGENNAKVIIAFIYALVFIVLPIFLKIKPMIYIGFIFSMLIFYFLTGKIYKEKNIFLLMFVYMFLLYLYLI